MTIEVPTLEEAIEFAVENHAGQYRKGSELPYIVHPMAVLSLLGYWEIKCPITCKAGIGHDLREDCADVTFDDIVRHFGENEALIIEELSFFPKPGVPEHIQKKAYMSSFLEKSIEAVVLKFADRCCNTMDYMGSQPDYARKYWMKASDLIDVITTRAEEIVGRYGLATLARMKYTKQRIEEDLSLFSPASR